MDDDTFFSTPMDTDPYGYGSPPLITHPSPPTPSSHSPSASPSVSSHLEPQHSKNAMHMIDNREQGQCDFQTLYHRIDALQQQLHRAAANLGTMFTSPNYTTDQSVEDYKQISNSFQQLRKELHDAKMLHLPIELRNDAQSIIDVLQKLRNTVGEETDYLNRVTNINARQINASLKTTSTST